MEDGRSLAPSGETLDWVVPKVEPWAASLSLFGARNYPKPALT
jgi:hypothetical protein